MFIDLGYELNLFHLRLFTRGIQNLKILSEGLSEDFFFKMHFLAPHGCTHQVQLEF